MTVENLTAAAITAQINAAVAAKRVGDTVQVVSTSSGALATGTTIIPSDDTIPQNSEGTALAALDTTITPTNAANKLLVTMVLNVAASVAVQVIGALFQDAGANALAAADFTTGGAGQIGQLTLVFQMTAGTTSATTFKARFGPASAATVTVNGSAGARLFGGVMLSSLTVAEIKA